MTDEQERRDAAIERALLAAIIAGSEDAIISKTLHSVVTSWNAAAERLFGWTAEEMIGQPILRLIPDGMHHEEDQILAKLRAGERLERYETQRIRKDGSTIEVSLTISPIRDATGTIVGASKIAHDITERKQAVAALAALAEELKDREAKLSQVISERSAILESERAARSEAERLGHLKDEFLATLSHELRTPLNAVYGWMQVLNQWQKTDQQAQAFEVIDRNLRVQTQIINDLLDMSRIVSGKVDLQIQTLQIQSVIQAAIETVRQAAESRRIRIVSLLDSTVGVVRGDPNRLQQVLWNLLTNAIKFTPSGGKVQIVLERVNSHVDISIEDTGIGIKPEFLPFVFDRFRQGDAGTTRRYGGLGLGLSIARTLVELHGGTVRVKSRGEGLGSTFVVCLPVAHVASLPEPQHDLKEGVVAALDTAELPSLSGVRVLVVDDEADGRDLLMRILGERGAQCVEARGAQDAVSKLGAEQFDVLLSDIGMPDMDGYELIREVRSRDNSRSKSLLAIAITAYARPQDRQRSLLAGFQAHLSKPIEIRELVATVASLLQLTR